jgi:hypothetical protein
LDDFDGGGDRYALRVSPALLGMWPFNTTAMGASAEALGSIQGKLNCTEASSSGNSGPVVANGEGFAYANGEPVSPLGTTSYACMDQPCKRHVCE